MLIAAGDAFFANAFASSINSLVGLGSNGETVLTNNAQVAIAIAIAVVWAGLNFLRVETQGWVNNFSTFWQIASTFIFVIAVFATCGSSGSLATSSQVWTQYYDGTGWSTANITSTYDGDWNNQCLVVLLGILTPVYAVTGTKKRI